MTSDNKSTPGAEPHQKQLSFKQQLDKAAFEAKHPDAGKREPTIVDKVAETVTTYVPPLGKILNKSPSPDNNGQQKPTADPDVPPVRPDHDPHIEEFVRDQHRSKKPDGKVVT
ncbi:uncharacterized protein B0I36DRAFT_347957 [Microdochium trichocladiopsis]|uniref:Uncharacterized protein n=1 Tax=Microdochium trichocladiopsis TaxID=1682393 RepID=A0A9P8Y918_9PEZI|nr:uncharacterized protein B0I36DRAFT_347957 [Microdochium trichocladiopsis]KAH7032791.1 hypothetical protein B0I36DRAFT_347957 [Microdochium trichocladiopsis]